MSGIHFCAGLPPSGLSLPSGTDLTVWICFRLAACHLWLTDGSRCFISRCYGSSVGSGLFQYSVLKDGSFSLGTGLPVAEILSVTQYSDYSIPLCNNFLPNIKKHRNVASAGAVSIKSPPIRFFSNLLPLRYNSTVKNSERS